MNITSKKPGNYVKCLFVNSAWWINSTLVRTDILLLLH